MRTYVQSLEPMLIKIEGGENGSSIKSTGCSHKGPWFFPSTHMVIHKHLELKFRGSSALFWPPWAVSRQVVKIVSWRQNSKLILKNTSVISYIFNPYEVVFWPPHTCTLLWMNTHTKWTYTQKNEHTHKKKTTK